jgi:hypothetical protein
MEFSLSKLWQIKKIIAFAMANAELFDRIVANSKAVIGDVTELVKKLPEAFNGDEGETVTAEQGLALLEADPEMQPVVDGDIVAGAFDGSRLKKIYQMITSNPELLTFLIRIIAI